MPCAHMQAGVNSAVYVWHAHTTEIANPHKHGTHLGRRLPALVREALYVELYQTHVLPRHAAGFEACVHSGARRRGEALGRADEGQRDCRRAQVSVCKCVYTGQMACK